jgi:parallel beta-helix repeat protein
MPRRYEVDPQGPFYLDATDFSSVSSFSRTTAEASLTIVNFSYPPGYVDRYATNTTPGTTDMTAGFAAALSSGAVVTFLDKTTYLISSMTTYTGQVLIEGNGATIKSDVLLLKCIDGNKSRVRNLNFTPVTVRYTIKRNPAVWNAVVGDVTQNLEGYMPTSQDLDIWSGLSAPIQAQVNPYVFPSYGGIYFAVSSASGASNVEVSGITGYLCTLAFEGYSGLDVHDNNFGGAQTGGAVMVWNALTTSIGGVALGFTLPRGLNNRIANNTLRYSSYSGAVLYGNDYFKFIGNTAEYNGESGLKTTTHDGTLGVEVACTNGVTEGNHCYYNYHDGIDHSTVYGVVGMLPGSTVIDGNVCVSNRATGITIQQSQYMTVTNNVMVGNGASGLRAPTDYSHIGGNLARGNCAFGPTGVNNQWGVLQMFDMEISGLGITSVGNTVISSYTPYTYAYTHYGTAGADPTAASEGLDALNWCSGGQTTMAVSRNITGLTRRGSFTPALFGGTTSGTFTYTLQVGSWSLIGDRIFFTGQIGWSATPVAAAGQQRLDLSSILAYPGSAYLSHSLTNDESSVQFPFVLFAGITGQLTGLVHPSANYVQLYVNNNGATTIQTGAFPATGDLVFSGSFPINATN